MRNRSVFGCAVGVALSSLGAGAAADEAETSPRAVMDTVFVSAPAQEQFGAVSETHHGVAADDLLAGEAADTPDILKRLPSANIATNSRGETLIYLRNAGERQIAALYDGALLNVPWDNRFDLNALPSAAIGGVVSATGTLSPQYGGNAIGALALSPADIDGGRASFVVGDGDLRKAQLATGGLLGGVDVTAAGAFSARDGVTIPDGADLPFHQDGDLRTNTDMEQASGLLRAAGSLAGWDVAASLLNARSDRGIAPESDREDTRFWRLPDTQLTMLVLSGGRKSAGLGEVRASVWAQDYDFTIDGYADDTYARLEESEIDEDRTYGARGIWIVAPDPLRLSFSANYLTSRHDQSDLSFDAGGVVVERLDLAYEQDLYSVGVDAEWFVSDAVSLELGLGNDWADYTRTGDKPPLDAFSEPVIRVGAAWRVSDSVRLRAAAGQKSRTPTMRELFGAALNRFLINPDLKPETIGTVEAGFDWEQAGWRISAIAFAQDVEDTIDQRRVDGLRQRINLEGSEVLGVELSGSVQAGDECEATGRLMWSDAQRKGALAGESDKLTERPEALAGARIACDVSASLRLAAEVDYRGAAYSFADSGDLMALDSGAAVNLEGAWRVAQSDVELFARLNNAFDEDITPQAGLPEAGRALSGGVRFSW